MGEFVAEVPDVAGRDVALSAVDARRLAGGHPAPLPGSTNPLPAIYGELVAIRAELNDTNQRLANIELGIGHLVKFATATEVLLKDFAKKLRPFGRRLFAAGADED